MDGLGYTDSRLSDDIWSISFKGQRIAMSQVEDYALLRAANVVSAAGYTYFTIINERNSTSSKSHVVGSTYQGTGSVVGGSTNYPEINLRIRAYKIKPTTGDNVYDANYILESIGQKYDSESIGQKHDSPSE